MNYFNIKWNLAISDNDWKPIITQTNGSDNWFIKNKGTYGGSYPRTFFIILWLVLVAAFLFCPGHIFCVHTYCVMCVCVHFSKCHEKKKTHIRNFDVLKKKNIKMIHGTNKHFF